jgi:hypothetical protein
MYDLRGSITKQHFKHVVGATNSFQVATSGSNNLVKGGIYSIENK